MAPIQVLLFFSFALGTAGRLVVHKNRQASEESADPPTEKEIDKKYDVADKSLQELYTTGCKFQHAADISAKLASKMAKGEMKKDDEVAERNKIEMQNVKDMRARCQVTAISTKSECDEQCVERHEDHREAKIACNKACKDSSKQWTTDCNNKADELNVAYQDRANNLALENQCYVDHCNNFPAAWKLEDAAAVTAAVEADCKKKCTDSADKACESTCNGECDAAKMTDCAKPLREAEDPTQKFCSLLWTAIEESSKVEWKTGYPKLATFR
eukprot:CAMPEP_0197650686 /NCGR_PEP_ID=MMETSP1338-20131121/31094_1 /TAXON_ID=43686 ORGANISM="Pelagodinium beii, Strain RCC1491" /NCGR_SAMPLE_ID=MMETSP1338 /ASSEMBLY_ACC=CAM_ASM_000754 /LENGTH=270 /DNA_ID=CAMNT_0043225143 /DNA_START=41 /DNA_END=853 /DNA_ORIENTATION=+